MSEELTTTEANTDHERAIERLRQMEQERVPNENPRMFISQQTPKGQHSSRDYEPPENSEPPIRRTEFEITDEDGNKRIVDENVLGEINRERIIRGLQPFSFTPLPEEGEQAKRLFRQGKSATRIGAN